MLSDRKKLILKAIIEEFIETGEPVGSKALTEKPYLGFSSATIRYDMQDLEEEGFLEKLHTSSGRAPSEYGYKYYVNNLITHDDVFYDIYKKIDQIIASKNLSKDEILKKIVELCSVYTNCYTLILSANACHSNVIKMELVPLTQDEAIMLIITSTGEIRSQKISIPSSYNIDDLLKLIDMFDNAMYDKSIYEIRSVLSKEASKPRIRKIVDFKDEVLNYMIKAFSSFMDANVYSSGLSRLFHQKEFEDYLIVQKVINAVENNKINEHISNCTDGLKITIGFDNKGIDLDDCSIISMPFYKENYEYGKVIFLGPKRMNYKKIISLVEYLAKKLPSIYK